MNRLNLLYQLDELLKVCQLCDRRSSTNGPEVACKGCETYSHILAIGKQLETKNRERKPVTQKMVLEIETYMKLKGQGKSDADIAKQFGIKQPTLIYYKKKWEKEASQAGKSAAVKQPELVETKVKEPEAEPIQTPKQSEPEEYRIPKFEPIQESVQPDTAEEKNTPCNCLSKEKKAEYERLLAALRSDLNEAHNQLDEKDEKIQKLDRQPVRDWESDFWALMSEKEELERKLNLIQEAAKQTNHNYLEATKKLKPLEEENIALHEKEQEMQETIRIYLAQIDEAEKQLRDTEDECHTLRWLVKKWA